ncbi:hypothetical protein HWN40_00060 [Methanolobus zinderi]|jgi:hypothetical protein|uniref:Uncharacterized protein n=1 Tax=Methanolobus zinderi TaxID=536044 RepID=A0A7D5I391_9EURY|nr:hypothetical protein [Methanolobus zinderi]KXS41221.1 MAG: hypothetical protein AWU59_2207 [Methanolobus sp. T82-4]QLC48781.1 hypothetical protein HWN40_00060 [Methanolobus zinderi]
MKKMNEAGQIILIAGFIIGIGIVVLTIMLNNIVYASNTASESSIETNVFDYSNVVKTTTEAYEKAYVDARNGSSIDGNKFNSYMTNYSERMVKSYSLSGFIFSLENDTLQDAYFTENGLADGNDDWVVIERVNNTDSFLLSIPNSSNLGNESNKFVIEINNQSSSIWSATMFNSSGNINLTIYNSSSILKSENSSFSEINITGNEIDGINSNLHFNSQTANQTYTIKFINGSQAMGTFMISGDLVNGDPFYIERVNVVNSTIKLNKNGHLEINTTIPVTLPKGQI